MGPKFFPVRPPKRPKLKARLRSWFHAPVFHVPAFKVRLILWVCTTTLGIWVGNHGLNAFFEPAAEGFVYSRLAGDQAPKVRFIDLSHLYEVAAEEGDRQGKLPLSIFTKLLAEAAALDDRHRPAAIGFDVPILPESPGGYSPSDLERVVLQKIVAMESKIPVQISLPGVTANLRGLEREFPSIRKHLSSASIIAEGKSVPLWYGKEGTSSFFPLLGFALARGFSDQGPESRPPALSPFYRVPPSPNWPKELATSRWMYVNYSLLREKGKQKQNREEEEEASGNGPPLPRPDLTVVAGRTVRGEGDLGHMTLLDAKDPCLEHELNESPVWLVGVAKVAEGQDTFAYHPDTGWISRAQPARRLFQHGAIVQTYLDSPLLPSEVIEWRVPGTNLDIPWCELLLDFVPAALGFLLVMWAHKAKSSTVRLMLGVAVLAIVISFSVLLTYGIAAGLGIVWTGYLGGVVYTLVEAILSPVIETIIGIE